MKIIPRIESYNAYGLNKHRNFVQKGNFEVDDVDEVIDIAIEIIEESECENPCIFLHFLDNSIIAVLDSEEILLGEGSDFVAELDGEYKFCCYSIFVEVNKNKWRII